MTKILNTRQAAEQLGVTPGRVRQYLQAKLLAGTPLGRDWAIDQADLDRFERPTGKRGPKPKEPIGSKL